MTGKRTGKLYAAVLAVILLMTMLTGTAAVADDMATLKILPGEWILYMDTQEEEAPERIQAVLAFDESGNVSLSSYDRNGEYAYSCEGTWSFEFVPDTLDRLTLVFTSTDNPEKAGSEYRAENVFDVYTESWDEKDTRITALLLEDNSEEGGVPSPIEEICGYSGAALYRKQGPNMKVIKAKNFVSLREARSTTSKRLAKVPVGAKVLAFPEAGDESGFIWCLYNGEYGYILAEYLQPIE